MSAPTVEAAATRYLERVRAALADLAEDDREELLDELAGHLAELSAEIEADAGAAGPGSASRLLEDRLGAPEAYAAELRASAGLAAAPPPTSRNDRVRGYLEGLQGRIDGLPGARPLRQFLPELRPGWWVLRGYCVAVVIAVAFGVEFDGIWPNAFVAGWAFLGLTLLAMYASVWIGRRTPGLSDWKRWGLVAGGSLVALIAFATLLSSHDNSSGVYYDSGSSLDNATDLRVYGPDGKLIQNAQVFDQNGNPIDLGGSFCNYVTPSRADGSAATNVYPRQIDPSDLGCDSGNPPVAEQLPALVLASATPTATPTPR
jgi:hypothetical protein